MSNASKRNDNNSTSSGHGALGMGGQPDDPRDLHGGREGLTDDDRPKQVDGASGSGDRNRYDGANETVGVAGAKNVVERKSSS